MDDPVAQPTLLNTRLVVRSSDIAKLISKPVQADERGLNFGKAFEEAYSKYAWFRQLPDKPTNIGVFRSLLGTELSRRGILTKPLLKKGVKMCWALLEAKATGSKPTTRFKEFSPGKFLAAQPDLYDATTGTVTEFKTYPIDDYAITQSRVFSYVLERPIRLVGLIPNEDGTYKAEDMVISIEDFTIPTIPANLFTEQEWCNDCNRPLSACKCEDRSEYSWLSSDLGTIDDARTVGLTA